jgi:hypothetical protein
MKPPKWEIDMNNMLSGISSAYDGSAAVYVYVGGGIGLNGSIVSVCLS